MSTMNISLTPQLEKLVQDRVKSGRYTSASAVMREALRLLETHDRSVENRLASLRAEVDAGFKQLDEGRSSPFDEAAVERITQRGRAANVPGVEASAAIEARESQAGATPRTTDGLALVESHGRALRALCRKFRMRKLHIFGSALRPAFDPAKSDLDVTVDFGKPRGMTLERQYFDFKLALESLFNRSVDVVEIASMPDSRLKRSIERSQVAVYEQAA